MSNHFNSDDDAQLDQLLDQAQQAVSGNAWSERDALLKGRILAALPNHSAATKRPKQIARLDGAWQWFVQPVRLAAAAALPLVVGFALGNATLITDSELLLALSEQESWPIEQMLDESQWSNANE